MEIIKATPCPFCGYEYVGLSEDLYRNPANSRFEFGWSAVCLSCLTYSYVFDTKEKALGQWNKRRKR